MICGDGSEMKEMRSSHDFILSGVLIPCTSLEEFPNLEDNQVWGEGIMLEMKLIVRGSVQKVGYRVSIVEFIKSQKLPVVGYVKNQPDGSVEILVQGDIEALKSVRRFATTGPSGADVREVEDEIKEIKNLGFSDFVVES
jgi:acylphosphatase